MGQWAPSTFAANTKDGDEVLGRPRLVPVPDRRRRRRAGRASSSAAATGSRSARTRRPRPSTSPSSSSPPTSPTRPAPAAPSCRSRRARESSVTDPNMKAVLDARGEGVVRPALPRPGVRAGGRAGGQRRGPGAVRGQGVPAGRRRQDRGCGQGRIATVGRGSSSPVPATVRRARRARARRRWTTIALFLAPALVLYGLLVIAPILQAIYYSGFDWNGLGPLDDFVGLENFKRALRRRRLPRRAASTTASSSCSRCALQLPFALGVALMLNARHARPRAAARPVLRAVRALGGRHRRRLHADAPARRAGRQRRRRSTASGWPTRASSSTRCSWRSRGSTSAST